MEIVYSVVVAMVVTICTVIGALGVTGVTSKRVIVTVAVMSFCTFFILSYFFDIDSLLLSLL